MRRLGCLGYSAHTEPDGDAGSSTRNLDARYSRRGHAWTVGENRRLGDRRGRDGPATGHNIPKRSYRHLGIGLRLGIPDDPGVGATFTTGFGVKTRASTHRSGAH